MLITEGAPILTVGAVLSTVNVALVEAGALLPAPSVAVLAAMLNPNVPSPVIDETVIVGVAVVPLLTVAVPLAEPFVFSVTFASVRFIAVAPL